MQINTKQIISMSEANRNFSKAAKVADAEGSAVIFKNNKPKYLLVNINNETLTDEERMDIAAAHILQKYKTAFEELAK